MAAQRPVNAFGTEFFFKILKNLIVSSFNITRESTFEIHADMDRTFAGIAVRIRECTEANSRGLHAMEGTREFQDRDVRNPRRRLGRIHAG